MLIGHCLGQSLEVLDFEFADGLSNQGLVDIKGRHHFESLLLKPAVSQQCLTQVTAADQRYRPGAVGP